MTQIDWILLGIMLISILAGVWRGFAKELISVLAWVAAIGFSVLYTPKLSERWIGVIPNDELRTLLCWLSVMGVVLFIGMLVKWVANRFIKAAQLSGPNRIAGGVFGLARGVIILSGLCFIAHLTLIPKQDWWQRSAFMPFFESTTKMYADLFPESIRYQFEDVPEVTDELMPDEWGE